MLTPEEVQQYRDKYNIHPEVKSNNAVLPASERIRQLKAGTYGQAPTLSPRATPYTGNIFADTPEATQARRDTAFIGGKNNPFTGDNSVKTQIQDIGNKMADTYQSASTDTTKNLGTIFGKSQMEDQGSFGANFSADVSKRLSAGGHIAGDIAGTAFAPLMHVVSALIPPDIKSSYDKSVNWVADKLTNDPTILSTAQHINKVLDVNPDLKQSLLQDLPGALSLMGGSEVSGANPEVSLAKMKSTIGGDLSTLRTNVSNLPSQVSTQASDLYSAITSKTPAEVDAYITQKFNKGVRPSVTSAKNPYYEDNALGAIRTIVENKSNLKITDQYGEPTGKVPETLDQFRQAVEQTKDNIFKEYDALQKRAGEKGATVPLDTPAKNLREIANNPTVQDLHPEVADYATKRADALDKRGNYSTQQTQDAIKSLNKSLEAYYKNPSPETANKATVDAMIVNNLREGLDATIESTEGPGYQELKNKYAQLRSIEKDVVHRAIVDARKNTKGLLDFTDIGTSLEAIEGILTLNPAKFIGGTAIRGIKEYYKYLNNPNTAIKKLFRMAEKNYAEPLKSVPQNQT
jgi:hypothetical protein